MVSYKIIAENFAYLKKAIIPYRKSFPATNQIKKNEFKHRHFNKATELQR